MTNESPLFNPPRTVLCHSTSTALCTVLPLEQLKYTCSFLNLNEPKPILVAGRQMFFLSSKSNWAVSLLFSELCVYFAKERKRSGRDGKSCVRW